MSSITYTRASCPKCNATMISKGNDPSLHFCLHCEYSTRQSSKFSGEEQAISTNNTNETKNKEITYSPGPPVQEGKTPIHVTWETYERLRKHGVGTWDDTISEILDVCEKFNKKSNEKSQHIQ